jgi:hypothetical protein
MMGSRTDGADPNIGKSAFQSGFKDCTAEAIHYLTRVEGVQESDPLIQGLKDYLQSVTASANYHEKETKSCEESPNTEGGEDSRKKESKMEDFPFHFGQLVQMHPRLSNLAHDLNKLLQQSEMD